MNDQAAAVLPVQTPCIGICSTVFGDKVCRGCKRYTEEIVEWNAYSQAQKQAVDDRLQSHLLQILGGKFIVQDADKFQRALQDNNIRYIAARPPLCWVNDLLRTRIVEEQPLETFGLALHKSLTGMAIADIRHELDSELYTLSQAHHQRYIAVGE